MKTEKYTFDKTTDYNMVGLGLTLGDLKEIHNKLIDMDDNSDRLIVKLSIVIDDEIFSHKHDLPF